MAIVVDIVNGRGLSCYNWSPQNWSQTDHLWQLQLDPRTICGTADGPPDQLWRRGWSPFATSGPRSYNPAFITFSY